MLETVVVAVLVLAFAAVAGVAALAVRRIWTGTEPPAGDAPAGRSSES